MMGNAIYLSINCICICFVTFLRILLLICYNSVLPYCIFQHYFFTYKIFQKKYVKIDNLFLTSEKNTYIDNKNRNR